jgi:D-alanyl-D-alanine carboxypeptidase (penicillin-binding protein 5/6)
VPWPGRPYSRTLRNRNRLLDQWSECDGIKTGYTRQAGRCLAASAYRDGWRLICVVLGSKDAWTDARNLLEWGFRSFYKVALIEKGVTRATLSVRWGVVEVVEASAVEEVVAVLPRGENPPEPRLVTEWCEAPIRAGEVVGEVETIMPDGSARRVEVVAVEEVPQSLWAKILTTPWALAALITAAVLAAGVLTYGAAAEVARARRLRRSA